MAQPLQPLPAQVAEDMVAAGVPTMLVREVGECIDVLNHYKPRDGAWTAAVFREVLGDCIGALQRVQSFLGESITRVARVPPDDERRELLQLLMQTVRKVPQACSQLAQHRMEMAWLEPDTLPPQAQPNEAGPPPWRVRGV